MSGKKAPEANIQAALLSRMISASQAPAEKKVVPFLNDDVPNYLGNLQQFERESSTAPPVDIG